MQLERRDLSREVRLGALDPNRFQSGDADQEIILLHLNLNIIPHIGSRNLENILKLKFNPQIGAVDLLKLDREAEFMGFVILLGVSEHSSAILEVTEGGECASFDETYVEGG